MNAFEVLYNMASAEMTKEGAWNTGHAFMGGNNTGGANYGGPGPQGPTPGGGGGTSGGGGGPGLWERMRGAGSRFGAGASGVFQGMRQGLGGMFGGGGGGGQGGGQHQSPRDAYVAKMEETLNRIKAKKEQKKKDKEYAGSTRGMIGNAMHEAVGSAAGEVAKSLINPEGIRRGMGVMGGGVMGALAGGMLPGMVGGLPGMAIGGLLGAKKGYNAMRTPSMGEQIISTLHQVAPHVIQMMHMKHQMDAQRQGGGQGGGVPSFNQGQY